MREDRGQRGEEGEARGRRAGGGEEGGGGRGKDGTGRGEGGFEERHLFFAHDLHRDVHVVLGCRGNGDTSDV